MPATRVLVVGNGPSAICLSLFLSGWWPYLRDAAALGLDPTRSLLHQPLQQVQIDGRGHHPVANLIDHLLHPQADSGRQRVALLDLRDHTAQAIPHRVMGRTTAGGSWHHMPHQMTTLSPASWMDLPGWSLFEWGRSQGRWIDPGARIDRGQVARYFADYVPRMGLDSAFEQGTVTQAAPAEGGWQVTVKGPQGQASQWQAGALVLAPGMYDRPNRLEIPGESLAWVNHRSLSDRDGPLLVVGAGLSAADAVLAALDAGRTVHHLFRQSPDTTPMARLDRALYTDYHRLLDGMNGHAIDGYTPYPAAELTGIYDDGSCDITAATGTISRSVAEVAIRVGSQPELSLLGDLADQLGTIDPLTLATELPNLYVLGPLAGDNFVRFLPGHALVVAADLLRQTTD